jgi:hypothetical protein
LVTAVRFFWAKTPSDQFLQGGLPALAGDLFGVGRVDGASTVDRLGLRWVTMVVGGLGLWQLARRRPALETIVLGAGVGFLLAYGGVYLPSGSDLQPYRYIDQAMVWAAVGLGAGFRGLWHEVSIRVKRRRLSTALALLAAVLFIVWVSEAAIIYRPPSYGGNLFNRWYGPSDEAKAICDQMETLKPLNGRVLLDDSRIGVVVPSLCGVEVIGGPFPFTWTAYGYTNANFWTLLDVPYPDLTQEKWRQIVHNYNIEWLVVNNDWGVAEWDTLSEWLAVYPEEVEAGPQFGKYQLYRVTSFRPGDGLDITADYGVLHIQNATPGEALRLPYHWIPTLEVWPPGSADIQSEMVGNDPIPFIVVVPAEESFQICDPTGCPER